MTKVHPTAIIKDGAKLGNNVTIGPFCIVHGNAEIGSGSHIASYSIIGYTDPDQEINQIIIGENSRIRSHSVFYGGSKFGNRLETGHRVTVREGTKAGANLRLGTLCDIQGSCSIGNYVRLHSNVHVGQLTRIGDFVWVFPYVVFTNDPHPPSDGYLKGSIVEDYAVVATMSVILPGVRIGSDALVAAHAMVRSDVEKGAVVAGVPATKVTEADKISLSDNSGPAYPWRRHFHRGYPEENVSEWVREFQDE